MAPIAPRPVPPTSGCPPCETCGPPLFRLQRDVLELDGHGRTGVELKGDHAPFRPGGGPVGHVHGLFTVDVVLEVAADRKSVV